MSNVSNAGQTPVDPYSSDSKTEETSTKPTTGSLDGKIVAPSPTNLSGTQSGAKPNDTQITDREIAITSSQSMIEKKNQSAVDQDNDYDDNIDNPGRLADSTTPKHTEQMTQSTHDPVKDNDGAFEDGEAIYESLMGTANSQLYNDIESRHHSENIDSPGRHADSTTPKHTEQMTQSTHDQVKDNDGAFEDGEAIYDEIDESLMESQHTHSGADDTLSVDQLKQQAKNYTEQLRNAEQQSVRLLAESFLQNMIELLNSPAAHETMPDLNQLYSPKNVQISISWNDQTIQILPLGEHLNKFTPEQLRIYCTVCAKAISSGVEDIQNELNNCYQKIIDNQTQLTEVHEEILKQVGSSELIDRLKQLQNEQYSENFTLKKDQLINSVPKEYQELVQDYIVHLSQTSAKTQGRAQTLSPDDPSSLKSGQATPSVYDNLPTKSHPDSMPESITTLSERMHQTTSPKIDTQRLQAELKQARESRDAQKRECDRRAAKLKAITDQITNAKNELNQQKTELKNIESELNAVNKMIMTQEQQAPDPKQTEMAQLQSLIEKHENENDKLKIQQREKEAQIIKEFENELQAAEETMKELEKLLDAEFDNMLDNSPNKPIDSDK